VSIQSYTLKQLAVAVLDYLDIPSADVDIAASGQSYAQYVKAKRWANQAAQELADHGPWPWLERSFCSLTVPANAYLIDLPDDVHRLLSDPSRENDVTWGFDPLSIQDVQSLRALSTAVGTPRGFSLTFNALESSWLNAHAYALGSYVRPVAGDGSFRYEATAILGTGTSAGAEPTWPTVLAATVIDNAGPNQITWTCRPALRPQLVVWPPADVVQTVKLAYARMLPEMTLDTDLCPTPFHLHYLVLIGAEAIAEEQAERTWGGGARQTFEAKKVEEFQKSSQSTARLLPLAQHHHYAVDGSATDEDITPVWIGANP
jgi:hypothetical protein